MKNLRLFYVLAATLLATQAYSMEKWPERTPPPIPPRTYTIPQKPLPQVPGKAKAPASSWQSSPIYSGETSSINPSLQRSSAASSIQLSREEVEEIKKLAAQRKSTGSIKLAPSAAEVKLTPQEEHSLQKIDEDFNTIILNLTDIAQHGANFAAATVQSQGVAVGSLFTEGGPILQDIASTTWRIGNIIKHCHRLSKSNPNVRQLAQDKIHTFLHSKNFINAFEKIEKFIASSSVPSKVRKPLEKLVNKIKELPEAAVNAMIKRPDKP